MATIISEIDDISLYADKPTVCLKDVIIDFEIFAEVPAGSLYIGGDSPSGLVLVGGAPAQRIVDLFDRENKVLVSSTISELTGTYRFNNLADRVQGYDVVIRGIISNGELDVIVPGVHPG